MIGREASRITGRRSLSILLREVTNECIALSAKLPTLRHAIVVLARRILDRAAQPQATDSACALSWSDIKTVSIEFAAMNQYV